MASKLREKMKDQLLKRTEESYNRKDTFGMFKSFFKSGIDASFWRAEADKKGKTHMFDIVPWVVGPYYPLDENGRAPMVKEGDAAYVLEIFVHQNVNVNDDQYVCPKRNYGEKCPICEHQQKLRNEDDYDEDLVKSLYPKRRVVYNIVCYDSAEEEDKGVQIFETSHWYMERHLAALAQDETTGEKFPFADPDTGKTISFIAQSHTYEDKRTGKQNKGTQFIAHKFLKRDNYVISDEDLEAAYILDEIVHRPTYEEIYDAYWGEADDTDDKGDKKEETSTSHRRRHRTTKEEPKEEKEETTKGDDSLDDVVTCPEGGKFGEDIDQLEGCNECEVYDKCALQNDKLKEEAGESSAKEEPKEEKKEDIKDEKEESKNEEKKEGGRRTVRRRRNR